MCVSLHVCERRWVCVVCQTPKDAFVRVSVCVRLRVFPISRSSLIIELILSSLLGRYTAASHSLSFSSSHALYLSLLINPSCHSPFIYHSSSIVTPLSSLSLSNLCPFPQLSLCKSLLFFDLSLASCSFTPLHPAALHHPSPLASLPLSSRGERSKLPLYCQTQTGCNQPCRGEGWREGDKENEEVGRKGGMEGEKEISGRRRRRKD